MTVGQLNLFGMSCVDFYFKVLSIFMLFSRGSKKRSHFALRVAAAIPALLLYSLCWCSFLCSSPLTCICSCSMACFLRGSF